jgi:hypothetical protein
MTTFGRALADAIDPGAIDVFAKLRYKPTPKQAEFHAATEYDVVFGGSRGSGKSLAVLMEGIARCVHVPGLRALGLRRTYPELKATLLLELARHGYAKKLGATWNGSDYVLKFPNGSILQLGYCDSLSDTSRYQGTSWGLLLVDELTLMLPGCVEILRETLRSGDEGRSVIGIRSSCNPGGPSHTAIKVNYVEATEYGKHVVVDSHGRTVRYIPSRVWDNPHVGKDYVRTLEAIPDPARRKAMLEGDWSAFGGQFFSEWSQHRHVVPRDAITLGPNVRRFCGIDFGYAAPFCALWGARDGDGRWWIYRELYEKGLSPAEQASRIMAAERKAGEADVAHFIDPSTVAKATGGLSVQESYAIAGLGCALAVNDRISGWQLLHGALADGPLCPYHLLLAEQGQWTGASCPMLHVLDGAAPNLCRTLPDAPYDKVRVEDLDTSCEDHAIDCARYLVASVASAGGPVLYPEFAGDGPLRPLTIAEMGGPEPQPRILGSPYAGDMRAGLAELGISFERDDGAKPGGTQRSPFV